MVLKSIWKHQNDDKFQIKILDYLWISKILHFWTIIGNRIPFVTINFYQHINTLLKNKQKNNFR